MKCEKTTRVQNDDNKPHLFSLPQLAEQARERNLEDYAIE
jgi:hypothetical protein